MNHHEETTMSREELVAGLARLGVRELEERMEVSPLLAGGGVEVGDRCICEVSCSQIEVKPYEFPTEIGTGFLY